MSTVVAPVAAAEERILVITKPYIGDTVLAIPFLRNLRRAFPAARIDVCVEGKGGAVLAGCPHIDEIIPWTRRPPGGRRRRGSGAVAAGIDATARALRLRGYTRAYLLKHSLSATLLAVRAGIPHRIGYDREFGRLYHTRAVPLRAGRHQVELYLDLLRADGLPVDDAHNETWELASAAPRVAAALAPLPAGRARVFLAMQATKPRRPWPWSLVRKPAADTRQWTAANWAALIEWLVTQRGCEVVLCGGPADQRLHGLLRDSLDPATARHLHDLSAAVPLEELRPLLACMQLCIGVDTGPVHVAASVGTPVVKLAGDIDQRRWGPWGTRSAVLQAALARDIPVSAVQERALLFLPPPRSLTTIDLRERDLREGSYRYEVVSQPAAGETQKPTRIAANAASPTATIAAPIVRAMAGRSA